MEAALLSAAVLACPVGMGLMMWFMAKGISKDPAAEQPPVAGSVEQLREEHRRLGAELERLDGQPADPVAGRS